MLVGIILGLIVAYVVIDREDKKVKITRLFTYLIPYWQEGDGEDRVLGIIQIFLIGCIAILQAIKTKHLIRGCLVFICIFISFVWLIKILLYLFKGLGALKIRITPDVFLTLIIPLVILLNNQYLKTVLEIQVCMMTLIMSLSIVYIELTKVMLGAATRKQGDKCQPIKLKEILTWLITILINLYGLVVFIQFYWQDKKYHFIEATVFNIETAIDLAYYVIVTFTTVGLGDIQPHTVVAKLVTMFIALSGMFFTGIFVAIILSLGNKKE